MRVVWAQSSCGVEKGPGSTTANGDAVVCGRRVVIRGVLSIVAVVEACSEDINSPKVSFSLFVMFFFCRCSSGADGLDRSWPTLLTSPWQ